MVKTQGPWRQRSVSRKHAGSTLLVRPSVVTLHEIYYVALDADYSSALKLKKIKAKQEKKDARDGQASSVY